MRWPFSEKPAPRRRYALHFVVILMAVYTFTIWLLLAEYSPEEAAYHNGYKVYRCEAAKQVR
jgi:hypothetical protein